MRQLISILLFTTLISANTTLANEIQNNCSEQLATCEQVVDAGHTYIKHLTTQLEQKDQLAAALERQVELYKQRALDAQPSWYERPSFVAPAAIVGTILTIVLVKKAAND